MTEGEEGKYLMACGKFHDEQSDTDTWVDINNNVAWSSSNPDVARMMNMNGEVIAKTPGETTITAKLADKIGSINVIVNKSEQ